MNVPRLLTFGIAVLASVLLAACDRKQPPGKALPAWDAGPAEGDRAVQPGPFPPMPLDPNSSVSGKPASEPPPERLYIREAEVTDELLRTRAKGQRLLYLHKSDKVYLYPGTYATDNSGQGVDSLERVTKLNLSQTKVTGEGLKHLPPLKNLSFIDLRDTQVSDAGLEHLTSFENLTALDLSETKVTDEGLKHLPVLKNLTTLALHRTAVTPAGLKHLGHGRMPKLTLLTVPEPTDAMLAAMAEVGLLHTLPGAWGEQARATSTAEVRKLDLAVTGLFGKGLINFAPHYDGTVIRYTLTGLTDAGLKHLAAFGNLTSLELRGTQLTDNALDHLEGFKSLTHLGLAGTRITDAGAERLAQFKSLTSLDLSGTAVTAEGLKRVAERTSLSRVAMGDKQVTDRTLEVLAAAGRLHWLPRTTARRQDGGQWLVDKDETITHLNLANTTATAAGLKHLAGLANLEVLELSDGQITGPGLAPLARSKRLSSLGLTDYRVTDSVLGALAEAGLLHLLPTAKGPDGKPPTKPEVVLRLNLTKTKVTGAGLKSLAPLRNLAELDLTPAQVTDDALESLAKAEQLHALPGALAPGGKRPVKPDDVVILSLKGTGVTDKGVAHLAVLKNLNSLDLEKTAVTEAGAAELQRLLRKCKIDR